MALTSRLRPLVALANFVKEPARARMNEIEMRRQVNLLTSTVGRFTRRPAHVTATNASLELPGRSVGARFYRAGSPTERRPLIVCFHGGGWVGGGLDSHDGVCRSIAEATNALVAAIDYRLAPEHRFPAAADDAYDATVHLAERAAELAVDPERIFVSGDSAGGNLAAVTAVRARDRNGPRLRGQILVYPVIEPDFDSPSYRESAEGYLLSRDRMMYFWETYVPNATQRDDRRVSPLKAPLTGLPPALVVTAEHDVLRSEGQRYAAALLDAGVPVETYDALGMIHGFVSLQGIVPEAAHALNRISAFVRRA